MHSHPESAIEVLFSEFRREIGLAATLGYPQQRKAALRDLEKHLNILCQLVRDEVESV
jgi:hypothetical protein